MELAEESVKRSISASGVYFVSIPCAGSVVVVVEYFLPVKIVSMLACLAIMIVGSMVPPGRDSR